VKRLAALLLGFALTSACGAPPPTSPRGRVRIAAAADLNTALGELIAAFVASHPVDISASYGSSGTIFAQLMNGAPFDMFLSADIEYPRRLDERGRTAPDTAFTYAFGRLAVWVPGTSSVDLERGALASLAGDGVRRLAVANPEHAPYGRAAVAALRSAGVYDAVRPRLVFGENVAQALQFAESGAADAAIVALSLARAAGAKNGARWVELSASAHPPLEQGGVIMRMAADMESARAFRAYMLGADGRAILERNGFALPER
jgi:molybdate transport system substrate-binding protein